MQPSLSNSGRRGRGGGGGVGGAGLNLPCPTAECSCSLPRCFKAFRLVSLLLTYGKVPHLGVVAVVLHNGMQGCCTPLVTLLAQQFSILCGHCSLRLDKIHEAA